ncbi:hypothetical protein HN873_040871 [Arachis hypogaea]
MNSCLIFSGVDNCFLGCLDHLPLALCLSILLFAGLALRIGTSNMSSAPPWLYLFRNLWRCSEFLELQDGPMDYVTHP